LDPARIDAIEATTRHDVIAFLTHVEELGGEPARWLHRGMTSSDVLDTALALLLVDATDKIHVRLDGLLAGDRSANVGTVALLLGLMPPAPSKAEEATPVRPVTTSGR
jgi:hypothetical protein